MSPPRRPDKRIGSKLQSLGLWIAIIFCVIGVIDKGKSIQGLAFVISFTGIVITLIGVVLNIGTKSPDWD